MDNETQLTAEELEAARKVGSFHGKRGGATLSQFWKEHPDKWQQRHKKMMRSSIEVRQRRAAKRMGITLKDYQNLMAQKVARRTERQKRIAALQAPSVSVD